MQNFDLGPIYASKIWSLIWTYTAKFVPRDRSILIFRQQNLVLSPLLAARFGPIQVQFDLI